MTRRKRTTVPDFPARRVALAETAMRAYLEQPTAEGLVVIQRLQAGAERYDRAVARAREARTERMAS